MTLSKHAAPILSECDCCVSDLCDRHSRAAETAHAVSALEKLGPWTGSSLAAFRGYPICVVAVGADAGTCVSMYGAA